MGSKYKNVKVKTAEGVFDSKKEYRRFLQLREMEAKKEIFNLQRQQSYELIPSHTKSAGKDYRKTTYRADFVYMTKTGEEVVEDVKGIKTEVYKLKKKLMYDKYKIIIKEI